MQQQWTISRADCDVIKSGFHTTGDDQLSGCTEKKLQNTSQRQTCTKKRSWSLFDCRLPVWSSTAFWMPLKPLYLRSMLSYLMRCTKNCNACSWHWSTERAQFSMAIHGYMSYNQHFKSWMNWSMKVCLICHIHLTSG